MKTGKKNPTEQQEGLQVTLPTLQPDIDTTWQYYLTPEGFDVQIDITLDDRTITLQHTMPWNAFIGGLTMGWEKFHQDNTEITAQLDQFIKQKIAEGHYTIAPTGGK